MNSNAETAVILRGYGISPSPQRIAIFDFLRKNPVHPTAETIFTAMRKILPTVSLTTVYNTLKLLAGKHAVQEVIIEDGELRFDADMRRHAHFKCLSCGKVFDLFPEKDQPLVTGMPGLPAGFEVKEIHLCLRGTCPSCRGKNF